MEKIRKEYDALKYLYDKQQRFISDLQEEIDTH